MKYNVTTDHYLKVRVKNEWVDGLRKQEKLGISGLGKFKNRKNSTKCPLVICNL